MTNRPHNPEELADYLDTVLPPGASTPGQSDDDPLVKTGLRLANETHPEPSLRTATRIQARLLAEVNTSQQRPHTRIRRISQRALALVASLTLVVLIFMLPTTVSASVPGDWLYPVKRTMEHLELAMASSGTEADVYLRHANQRAEEALILLERGELSTTLFEEALENMTLAAQVIRNTSQTPTPHLVGQTVQIYILLDYIVVEAARQNIVDDATIVTLSTDLEGTRRDAELLLPATAIPIEATATPKAPADVSTQTPMMTPTPFTLSPAHVEAIVETPLATAIFAFPEGESVVNVRVGPGTWFTQVETIQPGTQVEVIGENVDSTWLHIRLPDGTEGWVAAGLLVIGQAPPANEAELDAPSDDVPAEPPDNVPAESPDNVPDNQPSGRP
jgi:hypothetical protein